MTKSSSNIPSTSDGLKPDIQQLMAQIRTKVKNSVADAAQERVPFAPSKGDLETGPRKANELLASEELRYLNLNYAFSQKLDPAAITSHRGGFLGRLVVVFKRKLLGALRDSLLREYLTSEREFQANLVRLLNSTVRHIGERDAAIFWELVRKIDVDVTRALDRIEKLADDQNASLRTAEREVLGVVHSGLRDLQGQITKVQSATERHDSQLVALDAIARGLESIVARMTATPTSLSSAREPAGAPPDQSYLLLENRFRGSEQQIAERLTIYPPLFAGVAQPVLEIGAGRGELQQLFRAQGVRSYGVDLDRGMVEQARERGEDVRLENGLEHLAQCADRSLGGVIAVQVVEHLTQAQLKLLFELCARKVVAGGRIIFETINPRSMLALSSNYFRDPTHVWPLHPDTLSYQMELAGVATEEVRFLSPVAQEAQLREVPRTEFMTPRWVEVVELMNHNVRQLNDLLYGNQDYCVIGRAR